jgi:hypothetical protein
MIAFGWPNYPLVKVFEDKMVDLIFSIGDPISTPILNADKTVGAYSEVVPVTVACMDKIGLTATLLKWKAEAELRSVCESNPLGSVRTMTDRKPLTERIGSSVIYKLSYNIRYRRYIT